MTVAAIVIGILICVFLRMIIFCFAECICTGLFERKIIIGDRLGCDFAYCLLVISSEIG